MTESKEIRDEADEKNETDPLRSDAEDPTSVKKKTFKENCVNVFRNITVEPSMFLFVIACILTILTSQNLSLEKACRVNLNYTTEICDSLKTQTVDAQNKYEKEVQKLVTVAIAWKTYLTASLPCALAMFIGSWSDKTGYRKIFITIPVFGQFLLCLSGIFHTYYLKKTNLEALTATEAIIEGLSGSWCISILTMFAFISSITSKDNRTYRMGIVSFSMTVGFPIGMGVSGILLKTLGYYGCYGLAGTINFVNFLYNAFILKDPERTPEQKLHDKQGGCHLFKIFFDLTNIKKTFQVVFRKGSNNRRIRLCFLMLVVSILFGPMYGEISILYISTRYRFNWDEVMFSIFQAYNFISHTIGTLFSIVVFSKYLQWHDSVLGIISILSKIAASFIYCFAPNERIFFIAPIADILNGTALLALRSIVSKLVEADEFGKVNSIFALTENLMPLIYVPLYTRVYTATMEVLPGAVFLMGSGMTLPAIAVFLFLFVEHRRNLKKGKNVNSDTDVKSN
ncbi:solute carrier family 46 member 3-like [Zerene cesonia]|uniref:solute carrier family 46 member 3-like n=1 Tax=Zerene cesonia TaxID=33412 RepID=UPI0018E4E1C8|nr:solute carrier family 46 member 3-like [Zerene cesonia]